ncbi:MAG: IclR family transcriptional regulator [Bauldia sp.]|nr:IclR family transcriptional regulator [Bauldia sp.]
MASEAGDDGLDDRYLVQPVLKAMQVLQLVCEALEPVSLNQIVRDAALPKTTVFRYLRTLAMLGFVEHDPEADRYRPGIGLWRLSHASSPYETLRQACKPSMKRLRQRFNETINLGVLSGGEVVYLDVLESERSLRMQSSVGATDPLHCTALGKVFLAFRPPAQRAMLIPPVLPRLTRNTITDPAALIEQLDIIRTTGYAIEMGENEEGSYCIAAPILDHQGIAIAAMSLSAPITRFDEGARQAICAGLISAGGEISRIIRGEPPALTNEATRAA